MYDDGGLQTLTSDEFDIAEDLEEDGFVKFYDDGGGWPTDVVFTSIGKAALKED